MKVAKRHGISEQTIYTWRKRFGALQASDVKRLRQLEAENAQLKKLVAERNLEIADGGFGGDARGAARGLRAGGRQVDAQPARVEQA